MLKEVTTEFLHIFLDLFLHRRESFIESIIMNLFDIYQQQILDFSDGFKC